MTILSTKILTSAQKELLLGSGFGLVVYNAIAIKYIDFKTVDSFIENAIFTSKNAVKAILNSKLRIQNCFCVGSKTREFLLSHGYNVKATAENALSLGQKIVQMYADQKFTFFCGDLRRNELPDHLDSQAIIYDEVEVYRTILQVKSFDRYFDCIMFFSPSGVQSYIKTNKVGPAIACCIGSTTAAAAQQFFETVVIANKATVENVIATTIKQLKVKNN
ncbi:uroporphyrinogen-III synthase [Aquimarina sp. W85]|uniref:uroporphyrinogen-III synthase n=1 Tax=Aquimarina rhodophyticola TaxID=3342246 RepID=UPI0036701898